MRRLSTGKRVLDTIGIPAVGERGVAVRAVWARGSGLTREREALASLLTRRGTAVPW
jgi:hypothetical protein